VPDQLGLSAVRRIPIADGVVLGDEPLVLIAGPCVIESDAHALFLAKAIAAIAKRAGVPYIFKASFDKANRTSGASFRGPGLDAGLSVLERVKGEVGVPVLTDIHEPGQAEAAAQVADVLQIPAFLSRQTDLIVAAAMTGRAVNVKKGQFLAPATSECSSPSAARRSATTTWS
jgi:2-dehydro-3-deoxyphosphooctonate aldolase (KDO 8-P synthase)